MNLSGMVYISFTTGFIKNFGGFHFYSTHLRKPSEKCSPYLALNLG